MRNKIIFISSKGYWRNGWLTTEKELDLAVQILIDAGVDVETREVANVEQLDEVLDNVDANTLVWSNAYYVFDQASNTRVWLNDQIEKRNLPLLGSGAQALRTMLQKDLCQTALAKAGLPIPEFIAVSTVHPDEIADRINRSELSYPLVLKPNAESGSQGVAMAHNLEEVINYAESISSKFPHCSLIIEEFLPSDDFTCGFLQMGNEIMFLPTAYIIKSVSGERAILNREHRLRKWDDVDKMQLIIENSTVLDQLKKHVPAIIRALAIRDITRIDGRLDKNGTLRFFDVNGLPALDFPESVMDKQCFSCFPGYDRSTVFSGLLHTIAGNAFLRYGMEVPEAMLKHNLFRMNSEAVMKLKMKYEYQY